MANRGYKIASSRQSCGRTPATALLRFPISPSKRSNGSSVPTTLQDVCANNYALWSHAVHNVTLMLFQKQILKKQLAKILNYSPPAAPAAAH
jgi:hypothetical protein